MREIGDSDKKKIVPFAWKKESAQGEAARTMATIRAAFGSKRYKFASEELEERCEHLANTHDLSAEEVALEYERLMMSR